MTKTSDLKTADNNTNYVAYIVYNSALSLCNEYIIMLSLSKTAAITISNYGFLGFTEANICLGTVRTSIEIRIATSCFVLLLLLLLLLLQ